jgi:hypothetical protein
MRRLGWLAALLALASATAVASPGLRAAPRTGSLRGVALVSIGCRGPAACSNDRKPLGGARIEIAHPSGRVLEIVRADAGGRFAARLPAGSYLLRPLPVRAARAKPVATRLRADRVTRVTIVYQGPQQV